MAGGTVKSSRGKDDFWRSVAIGAASVACVLSFSYPAYGMAIIALILTLCLTVLNEIWLRVEAIRFMMEFKLDREVPDPIDAFDPWLRFAGWPSRCRRPCSRAGRSRRVPTAATSTSVSPERPSRRLNWATPRIPDAVQEDCLVHGTKTLPDYVIHRPSSKGLLSTDCVL
jgi:hypothetical protein